MASQNRYETSHQLLPPTFSDKTPIATAIKIIAQSVPRGIVNSFKAYGMNIQKEVKMSKDTRTPKVMNRAIVLIHHGRPS